MTSPLRPPLRSIAAVAVLFLAAGPLHFAAQQAEKSRRFEIGSLDHAFLGEPDDFYGPSAMNGPIRHEDGSVEVVDFYGRLTRRRAVLELPYHALRSPLRLRIRCHRFGLEGKVVLSVNGEPLQEILFGETSYPWGGIRVVVPQGVAERGPLRIELATEEGKSPPSHLPEDVGLGIDWIEIEPMSDGATLLPGPRAYAALYRLLAAAFVLALLVERRLSRAAIVLGVVIALGSILTALAPVAAPAAISRLYVVFLLAAAIHIALRWLGPRLGVAGTGPAEARFLAWLVALAACYHSALIFYPDHLPPDVPLHAVQVSWLSETDFSYDGLAEYSRTLSRSITEGAVLMETASGDREQAPERAFEAPYPPFFYLLAFGVSRADGDLRFALEMLAVVMASLMLALVFLTASAVWRDGPMARIAALLFVFEISVWHHVNRGHAPGVFGALFVLFFLWYLAAFPAAVQKVRGFVVFALVTMVTALGYTVAFIQISIFMAAFTALSFAFGAGGSWRSLLRPAAAFALGIAGAVALFYAPYLVQAVRPSSSSEVLLDRAAAFDPPAAFLLLRNQLRDTVRIYRNGHVVYVLLSFLGLTLLARSGAASYHRRFLWAAFAAYGFMLALKDPALLPRIFLHAKEDLFYAPVACMLAALPLAWLWERQRLRPLVTAVFLALFGLSLRDKAWNASTLKPQPLASLSVASEAARAS
jgi:hypothetical protein